MNKYIDYCSCVPDFSLNSCCKKHDADYKTMGKFKADFKFLKCGLLKAKTYSSLHKKLFTYIMIVLYYSGVSLFGWYAHYKAQKSV